MSIERSSVPRFIKVELPALQRLVPTETELSEDLFTLQAARPEFRLKVRSPGRFRLRLCAIQRYRVDR